MKALLHIVLATAALAVPPAALAGAASFAIVNGAGADMADVAIRRVGSSQWKALNVAAPVGKAAPVSFADPDCSFDIRATLADGKTVTWTGVNLCDVKLVTLRRNAAGFAWVDYD